MRDFMRQFSANFAGSLAAALLVLAIQNRNGSLTSGAARLSGSLGLVLVAASAVWLSIFVVRAKKTSPLGREYDRPRFARPVRLIAPGVAALVVVAAAGVGVWMSPRGTQRGAVSVRISKVSIVGREATGQESYDTDYLTVQIHGRRVVLSRPEDVTLVAFWRRGSGYDTDWHIVWRHEGSESVVNRLDGVLAAAGEWDFVGDGIGVPHGYTDPISLIVAVYPKPVVDRESASWVYDNEFGLGELPPGYEAVSAPVAAR